MKNTLFIQNERILLIKFGKRLKFKKKRYCLYQKNGLFLYFSSENEQKPKGRIQLEPNHLSFSSTQSLEKNENFCIKIVNNSKNFWIFPKNSSENERFLVIFSEILEKKPEKNPFSTKNSMKNMIKSMNNSEKFAKNPKNIKKALTDSFLQENPDIPSNTIDLSFSSKHRKNEVLCEKNDEICEEVLCEGRFPYEIPDFSLPKPHETLFKGVFSSQKPAKKQNLLINPPSFSPEKREIFLQNNSTFFQHYQKFQRFLFPKTEDFLDEISLKNLEKNADFALNLAQQFLWEFQLENADRIYELHKANPEFSQGFYEISLMKILVSGKKSLIFSLIEKISEKPVFSNINPENLLLSSELFLIKGLLFLLLQSKFQAFLSLKDSYSSLKKAEISLKKGFSLPPASFSRFLLISGAFQLGLSLLPSQYRKILELLGLSLDRAAGLENLKKCIQENQTRSNYARLLLGLYYIEGDATNFDEAFSLIKSSLSILNKSPLINWLASLFSWKFLQGSESLKLILRSLTNIGGKLIKEAYYLKFELAWFEMSQCQWISALGFFEELAIVSLNLFDFDEKMFKGIKPAKLLDHKAFRSLIDRAKGLENGILEEYPKKSTNLEEKVAKNSEEKVAKNLEENGAKNFVEKVAKKLEEKAAKKLEEKTAKKLEEKFAKKSEEKFAKKLEEKVAKKLEEKVAKNLSIKNGIILPHRNTLALIIAICYINLNEESLCEIWLYMVQYIEKKFAGDALHTNIDEDISRLSRKYLKRSKKFFLKYEVLYFLKEISKLKEANLLQMKEAIEAFFEENYDISLGKHEEILAFYRKNPIFLGSFLVEYASGVFLCIIILCVLRSLTEVLFLGEKLKEIRALLPKDHEYLLHHGFHWVGRCFLAGEVQKKEEKALEFFKLSKEHQECEFTMKARNSKAIIEVKKMILSKK